MAQSDATTVAAPVSDDWGHGISFREAFWVWARIAALSFGGPAGQIAVMHRILVEEKRWIGETRFLHALNFCMLLPGPEAQQLAVYIGWLLHRMRGGLMAGTLFIFPGFVALMILSWLYAAYGKLPAVEALFVGLKAAVLAVVLEAVIRIGKRALKNRVLTVMAGVAFVAIFFLGVPFPAIIIAAGLVGFLGHVLGTRVFKGGGGHQAKTTGDDHTAAIDRAFLRHVPPHVLPSTRRALALLVIFGVLWLGPVAALYAVAGPDNVFTQIGTFFSKMAVVTFGGAYAVLSYVAQQAVEYYGWLNPGEMLDGLGMAETTPGPLIIVLQFVGFMGAFRNAVGLDPMMAGTLGGILATWTTFVPCFLWIFLGAPYVERLRENAALSAALSAITAAVVGVVLNLAVWFALHTIFGTVTETHVSILTLQIPDPASVRLLSLLLSLGAMIALFVVRIGMLWTFVLAAAIGILIHLVNFGIH
ncbi:MAG: chromate efflux transporter [Rhodospirillaceae bacterium]